MRAYHDGSLLRLFEQRNKKNLEFIQITKRKIVKLNNPLTDNATFNFEQYYYKFQ